MRLRLLPLLLALAVTRGLGAGWMNVAWRPGSGATVMPAPSFAQGELNVTTARMEAVGVHAPLEVLDHVLAALAGAAWRAGHGLVQYMARRFAGRVGAWEIWNEPDGRIGRFAFTGYREVHRTMCENGEGGKTIWMTEMGWSTLTCRCAHPGVKERRPSGVSREKQAEYLEQAFACMAGDPYVSHALWFSLRDAGTGDAYDHHLGLQEHDGTPKPAFGTFRRLFAGGASGPAPPATRPCKCAGCVLRALKGEFTGPPRGRLIVHFERRAGRR